MRYPIVLSFILISFISFSQPAKWNSKKQFTVVSYNVENLFDTLDTKGKSDEDFTPSGNYQWNSQRYYKKINDLAKVLSSVNPGKFPDLIGLIEIENINVLKDLASSKNIAKAKYQVILVEGPDPRGIDCGLMYRASSFKYLSHKAIPIRLEPSNKRTRDILYVKGLVSKDTVHVFVNHWTSRRGGEEESEGKRDQCALALKHQVDSIIQVNPNSNVLIMGDFNDEPSDASIHDILGAHAPNEPSLLINLMAGLDQQGKGTYYYKGEYNMLDNLIVTKNLTTKKAGFRLYENTGYIYNPEFICFTNKNGDKSPSRTYSGKNYYGGYSDHFPVYMIFYRK
jgi:predicted extracellular nuclease